MTVHESAAPTESSDVRNRLIILVEDDAETRDLYVEMLENDGFATAAVPSVSDALKLISVRPPAAVVTDLRLGSGQTGLDLCRHLAADPVTRSIPVIVVSGDVDGATRSSLESAGCSTILIKPVFSNALVAAVVRTIETRTPGANAQRQPGPPAADTAAATPAPRRPRRAPESDRTDPE